MKNIVIQLCVSILLLSCSSQQKSTPTGYLNGEPLYGSVYSVKQEKQFFKREGEEWKSIKDIDTLYCNKEINNWLLSTPGRIENDTEEYEVVKEMRDKADNLVYLESEIKGEDQFKIIDKRIIRYQSDIDNLKKTPFLGKWETDSHSLLSFNLYNKEEILPAINRKIWGYIQFYHRPHEMEIIVAHKIEENTAKLITRRGSLNYRSQLLFDNENMIMYYISGENTTSRSLDFDLSKEVKIPFYLKDF
ncbi:MAG: hypothetical protein RR202_03300 [Bacteroidales bacterium]